MVSRALAKRIRVNGILVAEGPLSVGGLGSDDIDLPLARNGRGRLYVPGTSLTGVLRSWAGDHLDEDDLLTALFGGHGEREAASRLFVEDAPIDGVVSDEIWDGIGIDRSLGSTAHGIKFDRAVLPRGVKWPLRLTLDLPPPGGDVSLSQKLEAALGHLLQALRDGRVRLGASTSRGFGRMVLDGTVTANAEDWSSRTGVISLLKKSHSAAEDQHDPIQTLCDAHALRQKGLDRLDVHIEWKPVGSVMVKAPVDGLAVDALPFLSGFSPDRLALTIPGSSIKGALRNQAERIVRTVLGGRWHEPADVNALPNRNRHRSQVDVPLVRDLFGAARGGEGTHKGWLSAETCYATNACPPAASWRAVAEAPPPLDHGEVTEPTPLYAAIREACLRDRGVDGPDLQQATHVAIDRWTGGAASQLLFSSIEPLGVTWEPIRLSVQLDRIDPDLRHPAVALLLLVVRDLARQRIPLGHGANRGFGWLEVTRVTLDVKGQIDGLMTGSSCYMPPAVAPEHPDFDLLTFHWQEWLDATIREAAAVAAGRR